MSLQDEPAPRPPASVASEPDRPADFLQTVIRTAAEGICICAEVPDFPFVHFTVWNDRMTELTGYSMPEINRLGWYQTVYPDPDVRARAIARMERMREGDDIQQEEWTITCKDGAERVLAISTSLVGDDEGRAVVALMSDITERKRAELALRQSHIQLTMAQRLAKLGAWWFDIRSGTVWWSDEIYELFGEDPAKFAPTLERFLAFVHPDDVAMVRDRLERTLRDGSPYRYECRIVRPDGSTWWKRTEGVLERDADGEPIRLWGTTQDVTEQRRAEEARIALEAQLREARRLESIGVLAGGLAHEFNNLLTAIIGHTELAANELPPRDALHSHLSPIRDAAGRAAELCRKMLAYAGKGRVVVAELAVNDLVRQAVDSLGVAAVSSSLSADKLVIRGDAEQLRQLAANLVANAIEATPEGNVHVATSRTRLDATAAAQLRRTPGLSAGEYAVIEVRDDGHGMDDATLERAFEPFFSTRFPGRGLGLAVALGVTRVHRGGLDVQTSPGRGTTIRVYLPLVD